MTKTATDAKKAAKEAVKGKKTGKVHLFVLMDESGSMSGMQEAVVTGCNEFLHSFKDNKEARVWLGWFDQHPGDDRMRLKVKGEKIADVTPLKIGDYNPRGMTPLNDAIMDSLRALDKAVKKGEEVFVAIITDGLENASETPTAAVKAALAKREKAGWGFVYLGANQDAETTAAGLGLAKKGQAFNFNATRGGVRATMRTASNIGHGYTSLGASGGRLMAAAVYDSIDGHIEDDEDA